MALQPSSLSTSPGLLHMTKPVPPGLQTAWTKLIPSGSSNVLQPHMLPHVSAAIGLRCLINAECAKQVSALLTQAGKCRCCLSQMQVILQAVRQWKMSTWTLLLFMACPFSVSGVHGNSLQCSCKCELLWLPCAAAHGFYSLPNAKVAVFCGVLAVCLFICFRRTPNHNRFFHFLRGAL